MILILRSSVLPEINLAYCGSTNRSLVSNRWGMCTRSSQVRLPWLSRTLYQRRLWHRHLWYEFRFRGAADVIACHCSCSLTAIVSIGSAADTSFQERWQCQLGHVSIPACRCKISAHPRSLHCNANCPLGTYFPVQYLRFIFESKFCSLAESYAYDFTAANGSMMLANCTEFYNASAPKPSSPQKCSNLFELFYGKRSTHFGSQPFFFVSFFFAETSTLRICAIVFGWIGFLGNLLVCVLTSLNPKLRKWPGTFAATLILHFPYHVFLIPLPKPGAMIIGMSLGQCMLAFGLVIMGFTPLRNLHCGAQRLCKMQGFFLFSGLHITATTCVIVILAQYFVDVVYGR